MLYQEIIQKIKSLEIQGAEEVAKAAIKAFEEKLKETKNPKELKKVYQELASLRPTEPALRNALRYCLKNPDDPRVTETVTNHFEFAQEKIAEYGAKKIEDGMIVFTHCHSSTVMRILKKAWRDGKKFVVRNTETRPKFQGRKTAQELSEMGIPVEHYVDSAGRLALKKADLFLFGCDAITSEGRVVNKIGTEFLLDYANQYDVPAYSCTNSWKFAPETVYGTEEEIEQRDPSEVWENPPQGVRIINPAFEVVSPDKITGLITELGILKPESLLNEIRKNYPWMIQ